LRLCLAEKGDPRNLIFLFIFSLYFKLIFFLILLYYFFKCYFFKKKIILRLDLAV